MQDLSDEELLARYRADPHPSRGANALDQLLGRYHAKVAKWCYRFTGDRQSASDLAQDIFLRAYRNLDSFRGDSKFSTWLFTIARNHCVNEMKALNSRPERPAAEFDPDSHQDRGQDALTGLQQRESLAAMRALMEELLDDTEKKVMTLHFADEVTLDAVTRLLGLTNASGARAFVVSARRKLSSAVKRWKARHVPPI